MPLPTDPPAESPERPQTALIEQYLATAPASEIDPRTDEEWQRVWAHAQDDMAPAPAQRRAQRTPQSRGNRSSRGAFWGVALFTLLLCVVSWATLTEREREWTHIFSHSAAAREYVTGPRQQTTLTLHDGSRIILAPGTRLTVSPQFGRTDRMVSLRGEAYFDVRTAGGLPFVVRTGNAETRVLGTTFDIRYGGVHTSVRVTVDAGKVTVTRDASAATVVAGTTALVTDSALTTVPTANTTQYTDWTTGGLVFRRAPTADVLAALAQWYGYRFQCTDSALIRTNLTVRLSTTSIAAALATLEQNLDADLTMTGDVITLRPRRNVPSIAPVRRDRWQSPSTSTVEVGR